MADLNCELVKELLALAVDSSVYTGRVERFNEDEVEFILSDKNGNNAAYRIHEVYACHLHHPKSAAEYIFLILGRDIIDDTAQPPHIKHV